MLKEWGIKKEQVHLFVHDNAANMVKAMRDGSFDDFRCFAHTPQLVVHDGVMSQRAVGNTLAVYRHLVGHFKRSPLAFNGLKTIQPNLDLPLHSLKQDEPTWWNSTLHMFQSILEQKWQLQHMPQNTIFLILPVNNWTWQVRLLLSSSQLMKSLFQFLQTIHQFPLLYTTSQKELNNSLN